MTSNREKRSTKQKDAENAEWRRRYPKYPPFDVQMSFGRSPSFFGTRF
jgi:hypothetical protein